MEVEQASILKCKLKLEEEIAQLKILLQEKEDRLKELLKQEHNHSLTNYEILRYSRQIIVPQIGVKGQEKLKESSVLIIGCGGLGCPASQYLAGCGVGHIGLVDYDVVELNNLHRQLLHSEESLGVPKVKSAANALKRLNSRLRITEHAVPLIRDNALSLVQGYDVVVDASDNVATRYLINDACVLNGIPLVSGSAIQMEGQLTVYNYNNGPCYRCLFPSPPPPESVSNCSDAGVLGPVPGVIGVLQAIQVIHVLLKSEGVLSSKLLLFDSEESNFKTIKLRGRQSTCSVCGQNPTITKLIDYEEFCCSRACDKDQSVHLLHPNERISSQELLCLMNGKKPHVLIDVRTPNEFEIGKIPGSINIPMSLLTKEETKDIISMLAEGEIKKPVFLICRRGNDSQIAVDKLRKMFSGSEIEFKDLQGGLYKWAENVDTSFPIY